jgi:hypothetical protein
MSQVTIPQGTQAEMSESDWYRLCTIGGVIAWIQLGCLLITLISLVMLGVEPASAKENFEMLQYDRLAGLIRLDFTSLILVALYPFVAIAIYAAFRHDRQAYAFLAMTLILLGTLLVLANHSGFSMIYLSDLHAAATTPDQQAQYLAAGEALIAGNTYHSSAGFIASFFLQGGFLFISLVMWQSRQFSRGTVYTGVLANGLDLIHIAIMPFAPTLAAIILSVGGVIYLFWFPLLGRDLYRVGKDTLRG